MKHLMLDLETLGTAPGCAILTIGAVVFDDEEDIIVGELSIRVSLMTCLMAGLKADADTLKWWSEQSAEARAALKEGEEVDLKQALRLLTEFYTGYGCERIWGNGPVADVAWIEAAYRSVAMKCPWTHRDPRDFRGTKELGGVTNAEVPFRGIEHRAVDDARWQAEVVLLALRRLRTWREACATLVVA